MQRQWHLYFTYYNQTHVEQIILINIHSFVIPYQYAFPMAKIPWIVLKLGILASEIGPCSESTCLQLHNIQFKIDMFIVYRSLKLCVFVCKYILHLTPYKTLHPPWSVLRSMVSTSGWTLYHIKAEPFEGWTNVLRIGNAVPPSSTSESFVIKFVKNTIAQNYAIFKALSIFKYI